MKHTKRQRFVSIVLSLCMIVSMAALSSASASALTKADVLSKKTSRLSAFNVDADETVTAIITLSGAAQIDKDLAGGGEKAADGVRKRAQTKQQALMKQMDKSFDYKLRYSYSVLFNGIAIETEFENLAEIEKMENVTGVYLANKYSVPDYRVEPMTEYSGDMIGANTIRSKGYDGDGITIAVLDTGLNVDHEAFQAYGNIDDAALTKDKVESINTTVRGTYVSQKVPFSYDYADKDGNVADKDGHGTHVAGIAAGYVKDSDDAVTFSGQAPAAQILAMKVFFDKQSGTDSSIYYAALEDAYLLGADVVNMSLGAPGGFTYDAELENEVYGNLYKKLDESGVVMCVAAGNEYSMAYENMTGLKDVVPASYTDYGTVGSPSTYANNISVASVENTHYPSYVITVGDSNITYIDSSESGALWVDTFGGKDMKYVVIGGVGEADDYKNISSYVSSNEDWIALVQRGDITFTEKLQNAADAGAAGMICYNHVPEEEISMQIENFVIPAISITNENGQIFLDNAENNVGTVNVSDKHVVVENSKAFKMSDFSCWGTTSDLSFKPQITAPGGNIYSADTNDTEGYVVYSGTSMATPNAAGLFACILDYLRDTNSGISKSDCAELAKKLVLSTADILEEEEDRYYSPRKQGTGLMNANNVLSAKALLEKSEFDLKDSIDGKFSFEFTVTGLDKDAETTYSIQPVVLTDSTFEDTDTKIIYNELKSFELLSADFVTADCDKEVTIKGTESKKVSVSIEVTEAGKELLDETFENGCFIEGFVILTPADEAVSELHATYMGYYGDWLKGDILDYIDYKTVVDYNYDAYTQEVQPGVTYMDAGYTGEDFIYGECLTGYTGVYLYSAILNGEIGFLGDNLFDYMPYDEAKEAFSSGASATSLAQAIVVYPQQIRNAAHMIMVVSDKETGAVYYVDDTPYTRKAAYDSESKMYYPSAHFMWDGKDSYDEQSVTYGEYVANNTEINFDFYAWLDYDAAAEEAFDALDGDYEKLLSGEWDKYKVYNFDALLDTEAPKVENIAYNATKKSLSLTLKDNHMLSFAGVLNSLDSDGEYIAYDIPNSKTGESYSVDFDLSLLGNKKVFYLEASDYATNWPTQAVYIEGSKIGIKDYSVNVYNEDGSENKDCEVELRNGADKYNVGDLLVPGSYEVYIDGENSGKTLDIEYFGKNSVDIGETMQTVSLSVTHGDTEAYSPDAVLEIANSDTAVEFTPVIGEATVESSDTDTEITTDTVVEGSYEAEVMPGEYEIFADGEATGVKVSVSADGENSAKLVYYRLSYHSNTTTYLGDGPEEKYYFTGADVTVSSETFTNDDAEFLNWNTAKDGSKTSYKAGDTFKMPKNDVILYAIWSKTDVVTLGDVDCNGKINMEDVTNLQKVIAKLVNHEKLGANSELNSDVTKDGKVNMEDVVAIQKYIAKLIKEF